MGLSFFGAFSRGGRQIGFGYASKRFSGFAFGCRKVHDLHPNHPIDSTKNPEPLCDTKGKLLACFDKCFFEKKSLSACHLNETDLADFLNLGNMMKHASILPCCLAAVACSCVASPTNIV